MRSGLTPVRGSGSRTALSSDSLEEFGERDVEGAGDANERSHRHIHSTSLDHLEVLLVQPGALGRLFLRELLLQPEGSNALAEPS